MKVPENKNVIKLYDKSHTNRGFKVLAVVFAVVLVGAIALTITVGQQRLGLGMPEDEVLKETTPESNETMVTTTAPPTTTAQKKSPPS